MLQIFDNAMMLIKDRYWKDAQFNNAEIRTDVIGCNQKEHPYNDYREIHEVKIFLQSSIYLFAHFHKKLPMLIIDSISHFLKYRYCQGQ